ncbi:hypothetical protein [Tetragenococcus muriaticus]|uniref:Uncharacterized protein n=2 Tax=Tetragenococcus muriaticus TaxID=64642 RepID=A0A091CDR6_9ENTE|nr:hypothetical protein [Tetragenococcus muriaticus]KFN92373.1 hypothetical protein TMU3MR103_0502 [Tetragenococcus muriaticus 3MR10-3]KFN93129.1 hypothetical protein TMUPMC115_0605 [Tetragenococcus muriaticus PMC-11-5]
MSEELDYSVNKRRKHGNETYMKHKLLRKDFIAFEFNHPAW